MASAALFVLAGSLLTATAAYLYTRNVWAKRATLDFVLTYEVHDPKWITNRMIAIQYLADIPRSDCPRIAKDWSERKLPDETKDKLANVFNWLNHMEVVSIGIGNRSLHRKAYLQWYGYADVTEKWALAKPLVEELRKTDRGGEDLYEHFESLSDSVSNAIRPRRRSQT